MDCGFCTGCGGHACLLLHVYIQVCVYIYLYNMEPTAPITQNHNLSGAEVVTYRTVAHGEKTPPAVTRKFVAVDDGNCSPRFLRATTYYVPGAF